MINGPLFLSLVSFFLFSLYREEETEETENGRPCRRYRYIRAYGSLNKSLRDDDGTTMKKLFDPVWVPSIDVDVHIFPFLDAGR